MLACAFLTAHAYLFQWPAVALVLLAVAWAAGVARRNPRLDGLALAAAATALALLATWNETRMVATLVPGAAVVAALIGFGGFAAIRGAVRPGLWAALSAAGPLLTLAIAYLRLYPTEDTAPWIAAGLLATLLSAAAAFHAYRQPATAGRAGVLGAYAAPRSAARSWRWRSGSIVRG